MNHLYPLNKLQHLGQKRLLITWVSFFFKSIYTPFPTLPQTLKFIFEIHNFEDTFLSSLAIQNAWITWSIGRRPLRQEWVKNIHQIMWKATHRAIQMGCYTLIELESAQRGENRELVCLIFQSHLWLQNQNVCVSGRLRRAKTEQSIRKK